MFVKGLFLKTSDVESALRAKGPLLFGLASILAVTPVLGTIVLNLGPALARQELRVGFLLFCCVPTTVNSGVALTAAAGGNVALALLLTIAANTLGIFTVPFILSKLLSEVDSDISVDPVPMLLKLVRNILVPICVGRLLRRVACLETFVTKRKVGLTMSASFALALIPLMEISSSAKSVKSLDVWTLAVVCGLAAVLHGVFLAYNFIATGFITMPAPMRKSVVIMGSEKAITVAAAILSCLPDSVGVKGVVAIPVILGHFIQILIDASIVSSWADASDAAVDSNAWVKDYARKKN